jgi:hypothetical protein
MEVKDTKNKKICTFPKTPQKLRVLPINPETRKKYWSTKFKTFSVSMNFLAPNLDKYV